MHAFNVVQIPSSRAVKVKLLALQFKALYSIGGFPQVLKSPLSLNKG